MLPNRAAAYENAPLDELLTILLRQFKRPLKTRGVELTDADAERLAQVVIARAPLDAQGESVRAALLELVAESEGVLARWNLTFAEALDTPMDAMPGWETTAEFLDIANVKSNAELRIAAGSILLLALGDDSRAAHARVLAARPADQADLETFLARRVLEFVNSGRA
jgi:hypothetical protein